MRASGPNSQDQGMGHVSADGQEPAACKALTDGQEPAMGQTPPGGQALAGGKLAALIYLGASFVAALAFWLVTTLSGSYPAVARYGGAAWIFLLLMIVLMPIVIPRVNRWRRLRLGDEAGTASCPVPSSHPPSRDTSEAASP